MIMESTVKEWAALASHFVGECFDAARPSIEEGLSEIDDLVRFVAANLFIDCHLSSESVLLLVGEQKEWDADIITRSVLEGSFKFTFMLQGRDEEIKAKAMEYWQVLPRFASGKHSERAKRFLDDVQPDYADSQMFRELILDEAEVEAIRDGFTRQDRQVLEEKWSFSGISKAFSHSEDSGFRLLSHLAHGYGMSSHLLHKDADGIGIVWERRRRNSERQAAVRLAHSARLVSDICAFAQLRLLTLLRACKQPVGVLADLEARYKHLFAQIQAALQHFRTVEYGNNNPEVS
jgi:hypothetical protein